MIKRNDGNQLSNLEKIAIEWLDFVVDENTKGSSIYSVSDGITFYPTSDGQTFTDLKAAQDHERKYLLYGYENGYCENKISEHTEYNRANVLLKACLDLLEKQNQSCFVLNLLTETVYYDEADCDGYCLIC